MKGIDTVDGSIQLLQKPFLKQQQFLEVILGEVRVILRGKSGFYGRTKGLKMVL